MQRRQLEFRSNFHVVAGNPRSQAAVAVLPAGETAGGLDDRHSDSDRWLYVVSGSGSAVVEGARHRLEPGTLLLIERNESLELVNQGSETLETVNVFVPPAYSISDAPQPPARD